MKKESAKLKTLTTAETEAKTTLATKDDKVTMYESVADKTNNKGKMPTKIVGDKYAALEKAYFAKMASKKVFDDYYEKNDSIGSKIDAYVVAQTDYYKLKTTDGNTATTTAVVEAKKESDKKFKEIEVKDGKTKDELNKTNRALIDQYVEDEVEEVK